jgi:hypothetical protein
VKLKLVSFTQQVKVLNLCSQIQVKYIHEGEYVAGVDVELMDVEPQLCPRPALE